MFNLWQALSFHLGMFPPRCFCTFPGIPCVVFAVLCPGGFCVSRESPQAELNSPSCPQGILRLLQGLQTHLLSAEMEIFPKVSLRDGDVWLPLPGLGLQEKIKDKIVIPGQTSSSCSKSTLHWSVPYGNEQNGNESSLFSSHSLAKSSSQKQF